MMGPYDQQKQALDMLSADDMTPSACGGKRLDLGHEQ